MDHWSRRQVVQGGCLAGLGLLAGCGRLPFAVAPPATRVHRIGFLSANPPSGVNTARVLAFRQGMHDLGYVEGQNLVIELRYADRRDQFAERAVELLRQQPEVILVAAANVAQSLLAATSTMIPIVSAGAGTGTPDLVASGLAGSHARPGGTVTGLSTPVLVGKQLQLLRDAVPSLSRVAVLDDPTILEFPREPHEAAARTLGLQLQLVRASSPEDLEPALAAATHDHADGLMLPSVGWINANETRIAELALQNRLPSMWAGTDAVGRMVEAANVGKPVLLTDPVGTEAVTRDLGRLVARLMGESEPHWDKRAAGWRRRLSRLGRKAPVTRPTIVPGRGM